MTLFAIHSVTREVIIQDESFIECSDNAFKIMPWDSAGGEFAPYFLTTDPHFFTKGIKENDK